MKRNQIKNNIHFIPLEFQTRSFTPIVPVYLSILSMLRTQTLEPFNNGLPLRVVVLDPPQLDGNSMTASCATSHTLETFFGTKNLKTHLE